MPAALLLPRFNQTCKAFEYSGQLPDYSRVNSDYTASSARRRVSIRRRRGRRHGCLNDACLYSTWGTFSLGEEFAEEKLADGGRDRVMWTKGGVLWKINVVIEEKKMRERERETEDKDPLCRVTSLIYLAWAVRRCSCGSRFNQSSQQSRAVPFRCYIHEKCVACKMSIKTDCGNEFCKENIRIHLRNCHDSKRYLFIYNGHNSQRRTINFFLL